MKIDQVEFVQGAMALGKMPETGQPEIAFVGRSNVGKSSLINRLFNRKNLARTSSTPGKTQEINFYLVNNTFHVVDLPGFGYARVSKKQRAKWQTLIGNYITKRELLRVVFQLIDSRHPPTPLDKELMMLMRESDAEHVILLTKGDKLSGNERSKSVAIVRKTLAELGQDKPVILTSAKDGRGKPELLGWIQTHLQ
ncbi:MAG: YihA family ribosome biogenesis GTP-binding protein [Bacteroidetes Order II. Incertae sedis bacterium]|jgi:GTP-binding protein|nr:YihA family ribosome biogenesis GTP-binding protein [Bacteroidetes Order II. bacterium]MDG1755714.1 ribosome biogenesis GTP-binding protein YihA/YsxC [Rhodothermales bacterium]HAY36878.1 hypothetical protein [Bacteroidota bacterium]MBT4052768.1 YihA family ribosome biogenesis GTP-binding protein [Bacteroidetes Order II. bacterium]MBT4603752.1 YihA family ribosome biogenesis GTP-binding protein [Bacteroidetes Order II. bacterium]